MADLPVERPKISVCTPTFNRAPLLKLFLESILSQTHTDFEIVISDNCSTDATQTLVKS